MLSGPNFLNKLPTKKQADSAHKALRMENSFNGYFRKKHNYDDLKNEMVNEYVTKKMS